MSNVDAFVITSNPSLKDESIYHAEQLKTEIRKTDGMKVKQGCHLSGNGQGEKYFKVREISGNFIWS